MLQNFSALAERASREVNENILPFWMQYTVDHENGGFYGKVLDDRTPVKQAPKCLILGARLVWTFSSAYRIFKKPEYKEMADRAYQYFVEYFLDKEFGGAYYMLDYQGRPIDDKKMVYGQAFAIYGFSEYYRATGCEDALQHAIDIYRLLEKYAFDPVNLGYCECLCRDWTKNSLLAKSNINPGESTKTMNTHLHLIEGYTSLLRVWRTPEMEAKVRQHLEVMLDKIMNHQIHHYHMFFLDDWTPVGTDVSYGHDIEGTWLMMETVDVLGQQDMREKAAPVCVDMARACLAESLDADGAMAYEYSPSQNEMRRDRSWWVIAESVVGFLNAWQMTGKIEFFNASEKAYDYIDTYMVDHEFGEWFAMTGIDNKPYGYGQKGSSNGTKVEGWKAPYHNSRMCFEIVERFHAVEK